jgi:hypothetical protein
MSCFSMVAQATQSQAAPAHAQTDLRIDFHKPLTMHRHVVAVVQNDE